MSVEYKKKGYVVSRKAAAYLPREAKKNIYA
jgi:hypothetical protein